MAAGVTASVSLNIVALLAGAAIRGHSPKLRADIAEAMEIEPGTDTIGKCDLMFYGDRALAASASENLDMIGALSTPVGGSFNAAEIVLIFVKAHSDNVNNVVIGGAAATAFQGPLSAAGTLTLKPGEWVLLNSQTGWAVGAGASDLLKVANSAGVNGVSYEVLILGRTVAA